MKVRVKRHNFSLRVKMFLKFDEINFRKHGFSRLTIKDVHS